MCHIVFVQIDGNSKELRLSFAKIYLTTSCHLIILIIFVTLLYSNHVTSDRKMSIGHSSCRADRNSRSLLSSVKCCIWFMLISLIPNKRCDIIFRYQRIVLISAISHSLYLIPIKICAPLIFAPLIFAHSNKPTICALSIFAHWLKFAPL